MPMVDDVAKSLVSKPKASGCPRDTAAGIVECVANQFAFTLVYFFFERAFGARSLSVRDRPVRNCKPRARAQPR